jgi:hypothetical protein
LFLVLVVGAALSVEAAVAAFNWVRPDFRAATYVDAHDIGNSYRLLYYDQRWQNYDLAVDWIKRETTPVSVIATSCPQYLYLRSGRKAVMPPMEKDPIKAELLLDGVPATYLIADDLTFIGDVFQTVTHSVTRQYPSEWQLAAAIPDSKTVIYHRGSSAPRAEPRFPASTSSVLDDP